jgi:hypothetical protein
MCATSEHEIEKKAVLAKIEDALREAADGVLRYVWTLAHIIMPNRVILQLQGSRKGRLLPPYTFLAISTFIFFLSAKVENASAESGPFKILQATLNDLSIANLTLQALPVILFVIAWSRLTALLLRGIPRLNVEFDEVLAYAGGVQFGLIALSRLAGLVIEESGEFFIASIIVSWVITEAFAVLMIVQLGASGGSSNKRLTARRIWLPLILTQIFVITNPMVPPLTIRGVKWFTDKLQAEEIRQAFATTIDATLGRAVADQGRKIKYVLWLRNKTRNTYFIHREARIIVDWPTGYRASKEEHLSVVGWSGGERPILTLRPGDLVWVEATTSAKFPFLEVVNIEIPFFTTFKAEAVTPSGTEGTGDLAVNELCFSINKDASVTSCVVE